MFAHLDRLSVFGALKLQDVEQVDEVAVAQVSQGLDGVSLGALSLNDYILGTRLWLVQ